MTSLAQHIRTLGEKDNLTVKWAILLLFVLVAASFFPEGESIESEYHVGMIWADKDLIAPFSFPIYKEEREYQQERQEAAARVYPVFAEDATVEKRSVDSLDRFFGSLQSILDRRASMIRRREEAVRRHRSEGVDFVADSAALAAARNALPVAFTAGEWNALQQLRTSDSRKGQRVSLRSLERDVLLVVNQLYLQGILDVRKAALGGRTSIALRKKTDEQIIPVGRYIDPTETGRAVQQTFLSSYRSENDTLSAATKIALTFLSPNVLFQRDQTERETSLAMDLVPRSVGVVQENERIIGRHERVTEEIKLKLDSLRKAKAERGGDINSITTFIGKYLHLFTLVWLFGIYLFLFRKKIYRNNARLLLIVLIMTLEAFFAYLTLQINVDAPIEFLIVVPAASMLMAIIFDSRVAFYGTVVIAFIVAGIRGNDYGMALCSLVAGALAVYTTRDIKHRTQIFRSIIFIFVGYFFSILALSLERYEAFPDIAHQLIFAAANAVFSPVLTYGLLIFFERLFHVTTDLTLLELSDFNHPLLRELSQKAPGTFNHSVNMGTLAESAAEAIGANAILARVGAYYHDIGKVTKPAMFVENQLGSINRHERLAPEVSARIISAHVKDGIELGREYGLPDVVLDFIPMHHGTTKIGFFHEQAIRRRGKSANINPSDFRYPGPRPQTKETGIVMLADAVEASTRAIEDPTIQKIEERIDTIIKQRFIEGELDDCELTLRDLSRIKASFLKILTGIHHARIRYPELTPPPDMELPPVAETTAEPTIPLLPPPPAPEKRPRRRIRNTDAS